LRDLTLFGNAQLPRDVDVVVAGASSKDLEAAFKDLICDRNRFGGFRLRPRGWLIDIWALEDTWAFRQQGIESFSFDALVQTTFLNVEAVAAEVSASTGRARSIYSAGFFEAVDDKILDINYEPNPYPILCVVRSITAAIRINWCLSRRLASYIVKHAGGASIRHLMEIQESHYGKARISQTKMTEYLEFIKKQLQAPGTGAIWLPATRLEQLELSTYWTPVY
jgi:hypothetical protein